MTERSGARTGGQSNRGEPSGSDVENTPLVSAIITTYNRPSYLQRAVRSVLDQTYDNIELVVVDDHSETNARDTLADIDVDRLTAFKCIRHDENRGANAARNTGISASSGEYIAFLDDDDEWVPEKIERQVETFLESADTVGAVYTGLKDTRVEQTLEKIPPAVEGDITKALLCRNVVGSLSVMMVRADLAKEVRLDEEFPVWADLEWYINLSRRAEFRRIPEPLVVYDSRSHNRLSADIEKKRTAYERFVDRFGPVAEQYGRLFHRKMRGWTAHRLGASEYHRGHYSQARRYLAVAVVMYPFEPEFFIFLFASLGGGPGHRIIRRIRQLDLGV